MLRIYGDGIAIKELIVIDSNTQSIINFFGTRPKWKVLNNTIDVGKLELILLFSIRYIADIHNKYMFHGDIKPANIFYRIDYFDKFKFEISSDSGSLV